MRIRLLLSSCFVGLASLAAVAPATAAAESFPDKASGYVSDHTGYFVGALLVAILLLLLVVNVSQRRAKEKAAKDGAAKPGAVPGAGGRGCGKPATWFGAATRCAPHGGNGRRADRRCLQQFRARRPPPPPPRPSARAPRTGAAGCAWSSRPNATSPSAAPRGDQAPQGRARR